MKLTENMAKTLTNLVAAGTVPAESTKVMNEMGCTYNGLKSLKLRKLAQVVKTDSGMTWVPTAEGRKAADTL